jgi:hypothetical protein
MQVLLADSEIDVLVEKGYLKPDRRHVGKAVQSALDRFICSELGPPDSER